MPILIVRGDWEEFEDEDEERREFRVAELLAELERAMRDLLGRDVVYVSGEPCVEFSAPTLRNLAN